MSTDILAVARAQRAALERRDTATLARLVAAYGELYRRLQDKIDLLAADLANLSNPSRGDVARLARYRTLLAAVGQELHDFESFARTEINLTATGAIDQAGKDTGALVAAADPALAERFDALPSGTVRALLGFLDPAGPLFKRLEQLGPNTAQRIADTIVEKVALGLNPRQWAGAIRDELGGGLTDALRMARTVQNYSYREASRASYAANADVVQGWYWFAQLDADVCASCLAQHGTLHSVDEVLNDHHNGRCAMVPAVVGADNPIEQDGRAWFEDQPAEAQAAILGKGKLAALRAGKFEFSALSGRRQDDVYGEMRVEESLQSLVGG